MHVGLHGKQPVMKLEFSRDISKKLSNIIFNENPSRRAELCHTGGRTDRQTDMTKQTVVFRVVANARNKTFAKK